MSNQERPVSVKRQGDHRGNHRARQRSDGFATLTGAMMERRAERPLGEEKERNPRKAPSLSGQERSNLVVNSYDGLDRRQRDVSPVVERRRHLPPRVKVSVRLEGYRHARLKAAALLLERTHQDLLTIALDLYLDALNIPAKSLRRTLSKADLSI